MLNTTEIPNPFPPDHPVKAALKQTPVYAALRYWRHKKALRDWEAAGHPIPMPQAAQHAIVRSYAERYRHPLFIETGTLKGDMIDAMRRFGGFRQLHSIELQPTLAKLAAARFAKYRHITIHQGNSGDVLPSLLRGMTEPALFWLDGHYSGEFTATVSLDECSPVRQELGAVLSHAMQRRLAHVILIDNALDFDGTRGYPTIPDVEAIVHGYSPAWRTVVEHDIIRITPPR